MYNRIDKFLSEEEKMTNIVDSFLSEEEHLELLDHVLYKTPWMYTKGVSSPHDDGFKFSITMFKNWFWEMDPEPFKNILRRLETTAMVRMHMNMTFLGHTPDQNYHRDSDHPAVMAAVYYINDTNGGTMFEDGEFVEGKANRFVTFPANKPHKVVGHTEGEAHRVILNINYIPYKIVL